MSSWRYQSVIQVVMMKEFAIETCKRVFIQISNENIMFPKALPEDRMHNLRFVNTLKKSDKSDVLHKLQQKNAIFDLSWMKEEEASCFQDLSERFVQDAKAFDDTLKDEDIFQALRNIWIIWMLELLFEIPLVYHEAMFAYSMLYPYSDNLLDDVMLSIDEKKQFNTWFSKRLHGHKKLHKEHVYQKVDALVAMIEHHFPRNQFPHVYEGLYMIQDAQIASIRQSEHLDIKEIFDISVEKGGTSVIADGYLIHGEMNKEQFQFCVDFGFALQIVDDIQDQIEDATHSHHTLATKCKTKQQRAQLFQQCWHFFDHILNGFACKRTAIQTFVKDSCHELLAQCVLQDKQLYPETLVNDIMNALPLESNDIQGLSKEMKEKMEQVAVTL